MMLHELTRSNWRKDKPFRKGRGNSAKKGNYAGRGLWGQKSRSWGWVPNWFEGGQTPLHMRLPKLKMDLLLLWLHWLNVVIVLKKHL